MKTIYWVNYAACTPNENGPTRHFEIAKHLNCSELQCTIVGSSIHHGSQKNRLVHKERFKSEIHEGINFLWINSSAGKKSIAARIKSMLSFSKNLYTSLVNCDKKPDIIVGSSPHLPQAFVSYLAAKKLKVPFYLEVRDIWPESLVEIGGFSKLHPGVVVLRLMELFLYRRSKKIISVLPGFKSYLEKNGINRILIDAPNSPSVDTNIAIETEHKNQDEFTFIYAGSHGLAQNLISVVKAAGILQEKTDKNIKLKFVGGGFEKEGLIKHAQENNINNVEFLEAVSKNEISRIIASADAAILHLKNLPLFKWGISPNKLYDYMALRKPILFAVNTPFKEFENGELGIKAEADNPEDIAEKMLDLSGLSGEKLKTIGDNARQFVNENYSYEKVANKLRHEFLNN